MSQVLITPRSLTNGGQPRELARLTAAGHELILSIAGRQPTHQELRELVPSCDAWLAGVETIDEEILNRAPKLRVIARFGVGLDSVDLQAAGKAGITVLPSTGSNAEGVAELTILLALAARRPYSVEVPITDPMSWKRRTGTELRLRQAAVIGYGAIGARVAELLEAFGMHVSVFDPYTTPRPNHRPKNSIVEAMADADLVTLHCPPSSAPLISSRELDVVAPGATLINTARGSLISMDAVLSALESGQLGAYSCDAFSTEPPNPHRLWQHKNVRATPHIGGFTVESGQRSAAQAVDSILDALK